MKIDNVMSALQNFESDFNNMKIIERIKLLESQIALPTEKI